MQEVLSGMSVCQESTKKVRIKNTFYVYQSTKSILAKYIFTALQRAGY